MRINRFPEPTVDLTGLVAKAMLVRNVGRFWSDHRYILNGDPGIWIEELERNMKRAGFVEETH